MQRQAALFSKKKKNEEGALEIPLFNTFSASNIRQTQSVSGR